MANTSSTSRKPRTAARAASRPATARRTAEPVDVVEAAEPEVTAADAQEIEAEGHYVTAELCGEEVQVIPPSAWRASWQRALNQGQIDFFAEKILHPEDYDFYLEVDPTLEEWLTFVEDASNRSGESLGKSRPRSRSGGSTRRR
ncbi:hypothetical protein ACIF8T_21405 [Streptomyces sp. NPDC085946]|uniref:hypothetical protein n=1 Tax=Streptomyces sp. NPDC085946 TaxID=3365744 RepID=UPI0037D83123